VRASAAVKPVIHSPPSRNRSAAPAGFGLSALLSMLRHRLLQRANIRAGEQRLQVQQRLFL
jgi:hypothetical protein